MNIHDCDRETSECRNTEGSYECDCKTGYVQDGTTRLCTGIKQYIQDFKGSKVSKLSKTNTFLSLLHL